MSDKKEINLIWTRLVAGDPSAFERLYNSLYNPLFSYCLGRIKEASLAENAVADVFVKILDFKTPGTIEEPENWIFTIARNTCNSYWTKNNRRNRILSSVLSEFSDHKNDHFEEQLDVGYIGELIKEELDDKDYGIWEYHKEGYNNREIAEKLGMNEKTVANRKVGLMNKIKRIISKDLN